MGEPPILDPFADAIPNAIKFLNMGWGIVPAYSPRLDRPKRPDGLHPCSCSKGSGCSSPGKHPAIPKDPDNTKGYAPYFLKDEAAIRTVLSNPGTRNYGLIPPPGVDLLDLDEDGLVRWNALKKEIGSPGKTLTFTTPNGFHGAVRVEDDPGGNLLGIVTRRHPGGLVIGPGSVHPSGVPYVNGVTTAIVLIKSRGPWGEAIRTHAKQPRKPLDQVTKGERHDNLRDMALTLNKQFGLDGDALFSVMQAANATLPEPKTADEVRKAIGNPDRVPNWPTLTVGTKPGEDEDEIRETVGSSTADWPAPLDPAAFHGLAGVIVNAIAPYTEADVPGLLGGFLTHFGVLAGDAWSMHAGSWQHTNLFVALVGESSVGRKGTAFSGVREVYDAALPGWNEIMVPGVGSGEGLITYLKGRDPDPRALVYETEFGRLLTSMTREGSTLSPVIRDAWDGVPLGRHIASEKQSGTIFSHHVGALVGITDIELAAKLTSTDAANGFGNRFLWLAVRRPRLLPFTSSLAGLVSPFAGSLRAAFTFATSGGVMRMTDEASDRWETFYASGPVRSGLIAALTARREPQVARLAMIYALLDASGEITLDHLLAAEAVWAYADRSAVHIFGDSTGNPDADALLKALALRSPLPWDDAKKELGLRKAADLEAAVLLLTRLGRARLVRVERGGRSRREIEMIA